MSSELTSPVSSHAVVGQWEWLSHSFQRTCNRQEPLHPHPSLSSWPECLPNNTLTTIGNSDSEGVSWAQTCGCVCVAGGVVLCCVNSVVLCCLPACCYIHQAPVAFQLDWPRVRGRPRGERPVLGVWAWFQAAPVMPRERKGRRRPGRAAAL